MDCEIIRVEALTSKDEAIWCEMIAATPAFASPLFNPAFTRLVAQVRDDVRIAIWRLDGRPLAFLPHHRRPDGYARPVGAPFSDYTALITWPYPLMDIAPLLAQAGISEFQVIGLIDPYGVFGDFEHDDDVGFALDLTQPVEMPKKHRKNVERLRRNLELAHGEVRVIADDRDINHYWRMMTLKRKQATDSGLHDFLAPEWVQRMMLLLADAPRKGLYGQMVTLSAGGNGVCFHFGVRLGDHMHPWISTYMPDYAPFSPGQILLHDCATALRANGVTHYDLSTGMAYKSAFTNKVTPVRHGHVYARSGKGETRARRAQVLHLATRLMGPRVDETARRIERRLEHIFALEPDLGGRVKGVAHAVTHAHRRV